jgi:uncharacterized BrkB/YihY/UPF0761 family membrane protein
MTEGETQYLPEPSGIKYKLSLLLFICILIGLIIGMVWLVGGNLIGNYNKISNQASYLTVSKGAISALVFTLAIPAFLYILILRLFKKLTQKKLDKTIKYIIHISILCLISRLIYGFVLTNYLENNGYSYCYYYSSSSVMGNNTWVSNPSYCMDPLTLPSGDLKDWFELQDASAEVLSPEKVKQEILSRDKAQRARYPNIYN